MSLLALGGGTMAVLAVAAMVVAMTPRTASGPVALSSTTTPITVRAVVEPPADVVSVNSGSPSMARTPLAAQTALSTSFVAFPHAITPGPQLDIDGTQVADAAPADDDTVFVRTEAVTYQLTWDLAQHMDVPDGSVIFDATGDLVARVSDGDLLSLVDG